jgi:hypothetical protein
VLVPHSNAGLYAPLLAARVGARATVYVDAALPPPGDRTRLAPPGLLDRLEQLTDDAGVLPPWTQWWGPEVDDLFPDPVTRAAVEDGQPRLPLSYFTADLEVPPHWAEHPSAYLAFGDTYAEEVELARRHGWPLVRLQGRHLHQLVAPEQVAAAVRGLLARLTA